MLLYLRDDLTIIGATLALNGGQTPPPTRSGFFFFDYNDAATASSPLAVVGGAPFLALPNDGLGANTNKAFAPSTVTEVWDAATGQFDWAELELGDTIDLRVDVEVTTSTPNQLVDIELFLGVGAAEYSIPFFRGGV